jgi:hypothetical protein
LIGGFALLLWGLGAQLVATGGDAGFGTALYGSGTTFFTLGLGDVLPHTALGRLLVVLEAGMEFAFLALIISYIPVLSQAFSHREVYVSLLDARAGSPPSAAELLRRHAGEDFTVALAQLFLEWERCRQSRQVTSRTRSCLLSAQHTGNPGSCFTTILISLPPAPGGIDGAHRAPSAAGGSP